MSKLWVLVFVAACGAQSAPRTNDPPPPPPPAEQGSGSAAPTQEAEGPVCGTRGAAQCPADQFCNYQPGADCGETDKPGHCAAKPQMCAEIYKPVCGCDGKTYGNSCAAAGAGIGVRAEGACK